MRKDTQRAVSMAEAIEEMIRVGVFDGEYDPSDDRFWGKIDLGPDGEAAAARFVNDLAGDNALSGKVSTKTVEDKLYLCLERLQNPSVTVDRELISQYINDVIRALQNMISKKQIYIPIGNLELVGVPQISLGNITVHSFISIDKCIQDSLTQNFSPTSDQAILKQRDKFVEHYKESFSELAVAEANVEAEETLAVELAEQQIDEALDLLRCYTEWLFWGKHKPVPGLQGFLVTGRRACVIVDGTSCKLKASLVGSAGNYRLDEERLNHLRKNCAFDQVNAILSKPEKQRSDLERVVARAVRWIGRGSLAQDVPQQFLNYAVALECMLVPDGKEGEITYKISHRAAFLLSDDPDKRTEIAGRVKGLYSSRSKVAHKGKTDMSPQHAQSMKNIAVHALVALAERADEWQTHGQFVKWIEKQMYS